jgi:hypothetical protein
MGTEALGNANGGPNNFVFTTRQVAQLGPAAAIAQEMVRLLQVNTNNQPPNVPSNVGDERGTTNPLPVTIEA